MKTVRIKFIDQDPSFRLESSIYYKILSRHFNVVLSDSPDYIFDAGHGQSYLDYDCVRILSLGENMVPDFNFFDYAIGFDHLTFGDRYLRCPLFTQYAEYAELSDRNRVLSGLTDDQLLNRGFCSFVVSNGGGDPARVEFFNLLSKYKSVASGGRFMNNVGGRVADKRAFCEQYKFNIAFENSISPGYTTEKVMQPLVYHSVPIYYGDPLVTTDFSEKCMVRVRGRADLERAVEEVICLDQDNAAYLAKCRAPCFGLHDAQYYADELERFLLNIFNQDLEAARRVNVYGYQASYRKRLRSIIHFDHMAKLPFRFAWRSYRRLRGLA